MTYPPNYNRWPDDLPNPDTQPPYYAPQQQPPPPPKQKHRWVLWLVCAVLFTGIIVSCAAMFGSDQAKRGEPKAPAATSAKAAAPKASQTKPGVPKLLQTKVGDGTFIVGKDIPAGQYKTAGASEGLIAFCTWSTARNDSFDRVIDFGTANDVTQPGLVTLKKGYYFKTDGCQPWVRQ